MCPGYQQLPPWHEDYTTQCPCALTTVHCTRRPLHSRNRPHNVDGFSRTQKEFLQLRDQLLGRWADYSKEQQGIKVNRFVDLSICTTCVEDHHIREKFRKRLVEDLRRYAATDNRLAPDPRRACGRDIPTAKFPSTTRRQPLPPATIPVRAEIPAAHYETEMQALRTDIQQLHQLLSNLNLGANQPVDRNMGKTSKPRKTKIKVEQETGVGSSSRVGGSRALEVEWSEEDLNVKIEGSEDGSSEYGHESESEGSTKALRTAISRTAISRRVKTRRVTTRRGCYDDDNADKDYVYASDSDEEH